MVLVELFSTRAFPIAETEVANATRHGRGRRMMRCRLQASVIGRETKIERQSKSQRAGIMSMFRMRLLHLHFSTSTILYTTLLRPSNNKIHDVTPPAYQDS